MTASFTGRIGPGLLLASLLLLARLGPAQAQPVALPIPASAGDQAGHDVAFSGDYVLVGASFDDERGTDAGAAYVFRRADGGWILETKLTAADATPGNRFGWSVALDGETAVVGAPYRDQPIRNSGGAYVFERDARRGWRQTAALQLPPDDVRIGAWLGRDVAVVGNQILVSGPQTYLFARDRDGLGAWGLAATLTLPEHDLSALVWLNDTSALVSTWLQPSVHLFVQDQDGPGAWDLTATVRPSDLLTDYGVLSAIHQHGDRILAGASRADGRSPQAGAVYLFEPDPGRPGAWRQAARLTARRAIASASR